MVLFFLLFERYDTLGRLAILISTHLRPIDTHCQRIDQVVCVSGEECISYWIVAWSQMS